MGQLRRAPVRCLSGRRSSGWKAASEAQDYTKPVVEGGDDE